MRDLAPGDSGGVLETADILQIMRMLPHRYPFLMIDRLIEMHRDESCIGIKNVTINEPFFQGHFPSNPIMPGVLLIEGMAQSAGVLCVASMGNLDEAKTVYFMTIDKAKFRKPVIPGDTVCYHMEKVQYRMSTWRFRAEAKVRGEIVAEALVSAMLTSAAR